MITFLGMPSRTSGEIRGRQVAEAIGGTACFVDVHNPDWNVIAQNKTVLFVRTWEGSLAEKLKQAGYRVGYEIADMPVGDAVFRGSQVPNLDPYVHPVCDFYVVNNNVQCNDVFESLQRQGNTHKRVYIIPHHSTNVSGVQAPFRPVPLRVGYVGLPEQLHGKDVIERVCSEHGAKFVSVHPSTREECDNVFRELDIGVVFADGTEQNSRVVELMKRYKPNTKLSNFQAYGIPSICTPYESYLEWGMSHNPDGSLENDGGVVFVGVKRTLEVVLKDLLIYPQMRQKMSIDAFRRGCHFHIDNIKSFYKDL